MSTLTDKTLIHQIGEGNRVAFNTLFKRYFSELFHYGKKITVDEAMVEDCIQELFLYLFEHPKVLSNIHSPKSYLYTSIRYRLLAAMKKQKSPTATLPESILQFSHEDFLIQQEQNACEQALLQRFLNDLPARQREAIYLKYYNNLSTKEIAVVMNISYQGVLNMLYKAFKNMRSNNNLHLLSELMISLFLFASCIQTYPF